MRKIKELPPYEEYKELVSDILLNEHGNCPEGGRKKRLLKICSRITVS